MSTIITLSTTPNVLTSTFTPLPYSDSNNIGFKCLAEHEYKPYEVITFGIVPTGIYTPSEMSGILSAQNIENDPSIGLYTNRSIMNSYDLADGLSHEFTGANIIIDDVNTWENTAFDLHWTNSIGDYILYGNTLTSNPDGVYSNPHNIKPEEINLSGEVLDISGVSYMKYTINFYAIKNSGIYTSTDPYEYRFSYYNIDLATQPLNAKDRNDNDITFTDYITSSEDVTTSGLVVQLPFDSILTNLPSQYTMSLRYKGINGNYSKPFNIDLDHNKLKGNQYLGNLDSISKTSINVDNIHEVDDIYIEDSQIDRKRLSLSINDIAIENHTYALKGVFISQHYPLDFNLYTFSMKVNEVIPTYPGVNPYDIVKYYVEFNSNEWVRISPTTRTEELDGNNIIPKLFIFDSTGNSDIQSNVKFLNFSTGINTFRIKISIDMSAVRESNFVSPEIQDYKCIVLDKNQFYDI